LRSTPQRRNRQLECLGFRLADFLCGTCREARSGRRLGALHDDSCYRVSTILIHFTTGKLIQLAAALCGAVGTLFLHFGGFTWVFIQMTTLTEYEAAKSASAEATTDRSIAFDVERFVGRSQRRFRLRRAPPLTPVAERRWDYVGRVGYDL